MGNYDQTLRVIDRSILAAFELLPRKMDSIAAEAQLLKTALQESRGTQRYQIGGPARGLWQFELGSERTRGGVWGVYLHPDTRAHLVSLCDRLSVACDPHTIYNTLATNDVLAAAVARLNYWWVRNPMPAVLDEEGSWAYYQSTWNPGRPRKATWPVYHEAVVNYLMPH